jgi:hypothetical protein
MPFWRARPPSSRGRQRLFAAGLIATIWLAVGVPVTAVATETYAASDPPVPQAKETRGHLPEPLPLLLMIGVAAVFLLRRPRTRVR